MRASCRETADRAACEISEFYDFVKPSIIGMFQKVKKFPFNQSYKLIAYRNTIENELLT